MFFNENEPGIESSEFHAWFSIVEKFSYEIQCSVESCSDLKRCTISEVSVILYTTVPEFILRSEKHE